MGTLIEGFLGKSISGKKSRLPARLDFLQSATGLFLGLFMLLHMFFVATILISPAAMDKVTKFFEGSLIFNEPKPILVTFVGIIVFAIFFIHAILAMRKFPINYRQFQTYKTHIKMIKHTDTTMWFYGQALTGFIMFFLGSAHLAMVIFFPETIGSGLTELTANEGASATRMIRMFPLYLILLFAVEIHGSIGLYRLCVKWGWFEGKDAKASRKNLSRLKWGFSLFFLILGLATMVAYVQYGRILIHQ
ncbi:MAG: fumarate reductase cytochrome b subunit [Campylobacteraceae bacterium]|jgi:fumarate reductase subunit C|nr:fumarate reductase cytochrome b subunit [Campylobacteraceae bacterium]